MHFWFIDLHVKGISGKSAFSCACSESQGCCFFQTDATKITLAPSNADINQGENATLQCHASHDPTMDLTFTWSLNGVPLDLEEPNGHYRRMEGVSLLEYLICCVSLIFDVCFDFNDSLWYQQKVLTKRCMLCSSKK